MCHKSRLLSLLSEKNLNFNMSGEWNQPRKYLNHSLKLKWLKENFQESQINFWRTFLNARANPSFKTVQMCHLSRRFWIENREWNQTFLPLPYRICIILKWEKKRHKWKTSMIYQTEEKRSWRCRIFIVIKKKNL